MGWLTFWRGVKAGIKNFFRNGWLSIATISVIVLTLVIINIILSITLVSKKTLEDIQNKIDVSVYLKAESPEDEVQAFLAEVNNIPGVKDVEFTSKEEALKSFKEKHSEDDVIMSSLEEVGNPLQPSMSIKMEDPDKFQEVLDQVNGSKYQNLIGDVDYYAGKKSVIERLNSIISTVKKAGAIIITVFVLIAILVTFNSIRLTMYTYQREVDVMKLVGASHWFIRLPFLVEGILYGFFAAWVALFLFYPIIYFVSPYLTSSISTLDIIDFLNTYSIGIIVLQLGIGMILGLISSFLAIRRYLKV